MDESNQIPCDEWALVQVFRVIWSKNVPTKSQNCFAYIETKDGKTSKKALSYSAYKQIAGEKTQNMMYKVCLKKLIWNSHSKNSRKNVVFVNFTELCIMMTKIIKYVE